MSININPASSAKIAVKRHSYGAHFTGSAISNINCGELHNASAKFWVSFWFRFDTTYTAGSGYKFIFGKWVTDADFFAVGFRSDSGKAVFYHETGDVRHFSMLSAETSWTGGQWYHIIASISDVAGARFRINGGTAVTNADTNALVNGGNIVIGNEYDGYGAGHIGDIADVVIGTDDLSAAEELGLYNGVIPSDAVNIWRLNEGSGSTAEDKGSGGNDGTLDSAVTWMSERLAIG